MLAQIPDPRRPHLRVYSLVALLQFAVAALLCGSRSLSAMAQWGHERLADAPALLEQLGLTPGRTPSVATLHRLFKRLDVAVFEQLLGEWLAQRGLISDEALAVDGKTVRGVKGEGIPGAHLVSVYALDADTVLAQIRTEEKGSELSATKEALAAVPLRGRVVMGDALQTQREVCEQITAAGGDYFFPVKKNQPALLDDLKAAFAALQPGSQEWGSAPSVCPWMREGWEQRGVTFSTACQQSEKLSHGRRERREMWVLSDPEIAAYAGSAGTVGEAWPALSQGCWYRHQRTVKGKTTVESGSAITSIPATRAGATQLLRLKRRYWGIENRLHYVRDVTFGEDASTIRTGSAPQVMAAFRNLGLALMRQSGVQQIAAGLRTFAGRPSAAVSLLLAASHR
jgi:predicted transposase YbfD/YdcC